MVAPTADQAGAFRGSSAGSLPSWGNVLCGFPVSPEPSVGRW